VRSGELSGGGRPLWFMSLLVSAVAAQARASAQA
jgi:hypothetical protein